MKKYLLMLMMCFVALVSNAQYAVDGHQFFDNWSVGLNGGVQTNLHDWNAPQGAVTGITFDKEITPVFGLTFEGQVGWNSLANWQHPNQIHVHNGNAVDAVGAFAYGHVNLMNWWGGVNPYPRMFEVVPFAGVGYGHTFFNSTYGVDTNHALAKAGTNLNFNLGKHRAWTINVRPAVVYNIAQSGASYGLKMQHAVFEATAGVTYHFRTSNKQHHFTPVVVPAPVEIIREVEKEVPVEVIKEVTVVKETTVAMASPAKIFIGFAFDSTELSDLAKETLDEMCAKYKEATIVAWASYENKTPANYNLKLSEQRAQVLKNYLTSHGVNVLKAEGLGSVDKESNRIAEVTFM